jgi:hypothetical protein
MARWAVLMMITLTVAAGGALPARGEPSSPRPRHLSDARWGIGIDTPPGWSVSQRTGFAETIFLLLFPDGSRISLSAEKTAAHSTSDVLETNRRALARQGFGGIATATGPGDWRTLDFEVPQDDSKHPKSNKTEAKAKSEDKTDKPREDNREELDHLDRVRQLYLVRPGPGPAGPAAGTSVVLTLTAPARSFPAHLADLGFVVERITFEALAVPTGLPGDPVNPPGEGAGRYKRTGRDASP